MQKKIIVVISIVIIIVLILGLINDIRAFIRKSLAKFYTANFGYYEIYKDIKGKTLFCAKNITAEDEGNIQFLKDDFDFVRKGETIGLLSTKDGIKNVFAPANGYFIKGFVNNECESISQLLKSQKDFEFSWIKSTKVSKNIPFASIILSNLIISVPLCGESENTISIYINEFVKTEANLIYYNEDYGFYEVSEFFPEILSTKSSFKILEKIVYGLRIPKDALVKKSDGTFVYIVNGNSIKEIKVTVFDSDSKFAVVKVEEPDFNNFSSLIVVLTPKIFKIGEIVGNF
ncbi:hypothetical protein [Caldisericum exile]|uniref:Membrane fusion protein n=1 Tax=Caldisericum exile (strain DSM 21853 / NBRC 104410 / AZM16c01) TaxID=511051 RepID=A0A7U6GF73_CALEA|nr:hypothetical protein [Caldisericum exile]BAL81300.1 hypothetical protein CSE_11740 [Caldisericum exile AZM16c01]